MKRFFNLFVMALLAVSSTSVLVSCGGDDDNTPTYEDVLKAINNMKGTYTGTCKAFFIVDGKASDEVSIENVQWTAESQTILLRNFPVEQLGRGVKENDALKEALSNTTVKKDLIMKYNICYSAKGEYAFSLLSDGISFSLEGGDDSYAVMAEVYQEPAFCYVQGNDEAQRIQLVVTSLYVNGSPVSFNAIGFTFTSSKKSAGSIDLF